MNDAKIRAIRIHGKGQKSMHPPKVVKKPPFQQIMQNLPTIFWFGPREMETLHFTVNCAKSAHFANPHSESCEISTIHANSKDSLLFKLNCNFYSELHTIHPIRQSLQRITRNYPNSHYF